MLVAQKGQEIKHLSDEYQPQRKKSKNSCVEGLVYFQELENKLILTEMHQAEIKRNQLIFFRLWANQEKSYTLKH